MRKSRQTVLSKSHGEGSFFWVNCFPEHKRVGDFRKQKVKRLKGFLFILFKNIYLVTHLATSGLSCGMRDLSSRRMGSSFQ